MLMFIIVAAVNAQEVRDVETGRGGVTDRDDATFKTLLLLSYYFPRRIE